MKYINLLETKITQQMAALQIYFFHEGLRLYNELYEEF